jgi:hypothetical protein
VGQKERDNTKAGAAPANVVPLWPASSRDDLPTGYLEQVARRVQANLTDLVATADSYNLDLATEFRIAAELLQQASGTSHPLPIAESTGLRLTTGTGGCWELMDQNGTVLGADHGGRWEAGLGFDIVVETRSARRRRRGVTRAIRCSGRQGSYGSWRRHRLASGPGGGRPAGLRHAAPAQPGHGCGGASARASAVSCQAVRPCRLDLPAPCSRGMHCSFASRLPTARSYANCRPRRRSWPRLWASSSGMHPSDGTMPLPSATTTKRSLPPTAQARRRRWRMPFCERAMSRYTANKSLRPGCSWRSKQSRWRRRR